MNRKGRRERKKNVKKILIFQWSDQTKCDKNKTINKTTAKWITDHFEWLLFGVHSFVHFIQYRMPAFYRCWLSAFQLSAELLATVAYAFPSEFHVCLCVTTIRIPDHFRFEFIVGFSFSLDVRLVPFRSLVFFFFFFLFSLRFCDARRLSLLSMLITIDSVFFFSLPSPLSLFLFPLHLSLAVAVALLLCRHFYVRSVFFSSFSFVFLPIPPFINSFVVAFSHSKSTEWISSLWSGRFGLIVQRITIMLRHSFHWHIAFSFDLSIANIAIKPPLAPRRAITVQL